MSLASDPDGPAQGAASTSRLLHSELAFRLLVDAVADYAIFLVGADGRILTWNRGAQRIKGYTAAEVIGEHLSIFYTPEDRRVKKTMRLLRAAAEHGRIEDEGWRVRKDGTRFWADVVLTALPDENGVPYAYAKVTRDMTERRAAEERERQLLAERHARAAAEEALVARDRFLSIASHELKTPVASVQLAAEGLVRARAAGKLDDERFTASLRRMTNATKRLGALVDELLDVSRLTSAMSSLQTAPTDVTALTREVIARFVDADDSSRIQLRAPDEVWAPADASRMDQVVTNLIDNALKYSPPSAPIEVEITPADSGVRISIADKGIGLKLASRDGLFEAFGRGENAENVQGLGLGLYISQRIVEQHGGRITAHPREGGGTVFVVWIPGDGTAGQHGAA